MDLLRDLLDHISKTISFKKYFEYTSELLKNNYGVKKTGFLYYDSNESVLYAGEEYGYNFIDERKKINLSKEKIDISLFFEDKNENPYFYEIKLKNRVMGIFFIDKEIEEIDIIINIFSIVFERLVLSGSLPWQKFEDEIKTEYLIEMLKDYGMKTKISGKPFCFGVIELKAYENIFKEPLGFIDAKIFEYIISVIRENLEFEDEVFALPMDRIAVVLSSTEIEKVKKIFINIERIIENYKLNDIDAMKDKIKYKIKINYGYSFYNIEDLVQKDIVKEAFNMLFQNKKMEGWLKKI